MSVEAEHAGAGVSTMRKTTSDDVVSLWATVLRDVRLLLVSLWLGGAVFFSATVAPSAFAVLRARNVPYANEAAGAIVTRTLAVVNIAGFVIALFLLASAFLFRKRTTRRAFAMETISSALMALATGVGQWLIAARMIALRAAMGRPIDDVAVDDSLRISFNSLHGYSVAALGVAIIAAAVTLLLIARRNRDQRLEVRG